MDILEHCSLAQRTTLKVGGFAVAELRMFFVHELEAMERALEKLGGSPYVLGGGSNILAHDGELNISLLRPLIGAGEEPVILKKNELPQCPRVEQWLKAGRVFVRVGAGLRMPVLLAWCARHGFTGLEGLVGVPGNVGGAVAMNAGAYGQCMDDVLVEVRAYAHKKFAAYHENTWNCSYRHFALADTENFMICDGILALQPCPSEQVRATMQRNILQKKATQPLTESTAGCAFKNPSGHSAGKLLDEFGFKGKKNGGMCFSSKHANFLANQGHGSYAAAHDLLCEAKESIAAQSGVNLELEVRVWPCPPF